jgi:8-oxo-dGTP pyrophosphatase MutT (NUDIX family)
VAYKIVIRKNGKSHGEMGPYSSPQAAQSDARTIKIRLTEDADVVVQRIEVGGVKYVPRQSSGSSSGGSSSSGKPKSSSPSSPPPWWQQHTTGSSSKLEAAMGPKWGGSGSMPAGPQAPYVPPPPRIAAGGVVINEDGLILVREPLNHFDGYVWSLPKGGVDPGETDEQGALREVEEETGVRAEIVARIPGEWKGGTSLNRYFLMRPIEVTGVLDEETEQIAFVTYDEARELLGMTTNKRGRERDLEVLDAGYAMWLQQQSGLPMTGTGPGPKANPRRHTFA